MAIYPANPAPILPALIESTGLPVPRLVVIDVGCSGGVEPEWAPLMPYMDVYAIDPLVKEIERLRRDAPLPNVRYVDGHVVGPPRPDWDSPFWTKWFERTATVAAWNHLSKNYNQEVFNAGQEVVMSDYRFTLDEFCAQEGIARVDFLKSDTDGHDWNVLRGGPETLKSVLAIHIEAMFSDEGTGAIFRKIDDTLQRSGFFLGGLNPITYTRAALPGRFKYSNLADNETGATLWADFFYLRDVVEHGPHDLDTALRLAVLAELYNLTDVAAEALLKVRDQAHDKVTVLLDGLVRYSGRPDAGSYDELMRLFANDPASFGPA